MLPQPTGRLRAGRIPGAPALLSGADHPYRAPNPAPSDVACLPHRERRLANTATHSTSGSLDPSTQLRRGRAPDPDERLVHLDQGLPLAPGQRRVLLGSPQPPSTARPPRAARPPDRRACPPTPADASAIDLQHRLRRGPQARARSATDTDSRSPTSSANWRIDTSDSSRCRRMNSPNDEALLSATSPAYAAVRARSRATSRRVSVLILDEHNLAEMARHGVSATGGRS